MVEESVIWENVPEPTQKVPFIIEDVKEEENTTFEFTVTAEQEVAGFDVGDMIYLVGGVWRVLIDDQDEDEELTSVKYHIQVDHRYDPKEVRAAVTKLVENLYANEKEEE